MRLQKDLREFVELLISHRVDFVVVGGHAVAFHGHPRYTGDIDFLVRPTQENAVRLLEVLAVFGFGDAGITVEELMLPERVIQLGVPPNRVDLLTSISGVQIEDAFASRVNSQLDGLPVFFLGREVLLRNKLAAGRTKDLADIQELNNRGE